MRAGRSTRTLHGSWRSHDTEAQARAAEIRLSLQLPHPDAAVRRKRAAGNGS
jgi:hypothetical protein